MIYFIQAGDSGPIKIGRSGDPPARLRQFQTGAPDRLQLLIATPGDADEERRLHTMFGRYRLRGEWFEPAPEVVDFICDRVPIQHIEIARCPVCGNLYAPNLPETLEPHRQTHQAILRGALPFPLREFIKEFGWNVARGEAGSQKSLRHWDTEDGKRAIVYSWWARAREGGLPDEDLEDFILEHLAYMDALVSGTSKQTEQTGDAIKERWGKYG